MLTKQASDAPRALTLTTTTTQTTEKNTLAPDATLAETLSYFMELLRKLRTLQQRQSALLQMVYEFESSKWKTDDETKDSSSEFTHIFRDSPLGPILPWDVILTLRQWHQVSVLESSSFIHSSLTLAPTPSRALSPPSPTRSGAGGGSGTCSSLGRTT